MVFSPLDERLGLLPSPYSPFLLETIVRWGTRLPFGQVAEELAQTFGVGISADTVRRLTEQAERLQVAREERELERLEQEAPEEPEGPAVQQVSVDGAMVPLVGGAWTEVRTIAIGTVEQREEGVKAVDLSYFSRHCSAEEFRRQTTLPTHERGTRRAGTVLVIADGASWIQKVFDEQCPGAIRILDFPHAVSYLSDAAQAVFGAGSREAAVWLDEWAARLKTKEPAEVLQALRTLPAQTEEAVAAREGALQYLEARQEQIRYADFQNQGYPIGSGIVESACKLVVEEHLKGSGRHWAPANVGPLLALRGRLRSGQWKPTWEGIAQEWRAEVRRQRAEKRKHRRARQAEQRTAAAEQVSGASKPERAKTMVNRHATADHPWRRDNHLPKTWSHPPKL